MNTQSKSNFFILGGISGFAGTLCYILAITVSLPSLLSYGLAMVWPVLSVIFAFAIYHYIQLHRQSVANQLAFIFTAMAFLIVSLMISVQLVVKSGMEEAVIKAGGVEKDHLALIIASSLRWVDLGMDLAWDMFIGTGFIFLARVFWDHPKFGPWWSIPVILLGLAVIALNLATFPHPPDTRGVPDVGPLIGTFMLILAIRFFVIGLKMKKE